MGLSQITAIDTHGLTSAPVLFSSPDDVLTLLLSSLMLFVLVVSVLNRLLQSRLGLLPPRKAYDTLYNFSCGLFRVLAALLAVPAFRAMVEYIGSDQVDMELPSVFIKQLLLRSMGFSIAPVIFDLCARREIQFMKTIHHIACCFVVIVHMDWRIASPMVVYHSLTSSFMTPVDIALGLYSLQANSQTTARWLTWATYHALVVFTLAQIGVLRSMWKAYQHAIRAGEYGETRLTVVFVASLLADLMLFAAQLDHVFVLRFLAAKRRRESLDKHL